jgi:hypothetical protein
VSDLAQASEDELGCQTMLVNEMKQSDQEKNTNFWLDWYYMR